MGPHSRYACPWTESNGHLLLRTELFCPLNYRDSPACFLISYIFDIVEEMDYEQKIIVAIQKTLPAVISIAASKNVADVQTEMTKMGLDPQQFADRLSQESADDGTVTISSGSAFVVDPSGIVLTNKHVIADKKARYAAVIGKDHHEMEIVGTDPLADIAIIKLKSPPNNLSVL